MFESIGAIFKEQYGEQFNEQLGEQKAGQNGQKTGLMEDEYIDESSGLIYCKKCLTARQLKIKILDKNRIVRCICNCQKEEIKSEEIKRKEIEEQIKIAKLMDSSLLGERYRNITFDKTETGHNEYFDKAIVRCSNYCKVSEEVLKNGYGIYLFGGSGTGKTHLTACMANELIKQYRQVLFTNFFEIGKMIRATFNGKGNETNQINRIANVDFLFIDDIGTERVTNRGEDTWMQEKIFEIINKRYNNKKPTIFTSNYSIKELIEDRGMMTKTVDRIVEMSNLILKIEGDSYRITSRKTNIPY